MMIKSDVYTEGEFKAVKDLVSLEDSLLVSSQMANSLLLLSQHEKMLKDAQSKMSESAAAGPSTTGGDQSKDTTKTTDERKFAIGETLEDEDEETNDQN